MMICDKCGYDIQVGEWPYCGDAKNTHGRPNKTKGWEPFFDEGLGQVVTGMGDINKACRPYWENDNIVHIQPRDKSPQYYRELNERRRERNQK
jgi:hypothetical protein